MEMALDVVGHRVHRGVAILGPQCERLEHDRVDIAAQRAAGAATDDHVARPPQTDACRRSLAGQQLIEHHAAGIHVGRDAQGFAGQLLGRRVRGGQRTRRCRASGRPGIAIAELGDPEVQQLHVTAIGHQDVGGLQVLVDHQARVRVGDRARDQHEQAQTIANRQLRIRDVLIDRTTIDVLQREIRLPAAGHARVVESGDIRMVERGQNLALGDEPVRERGVPPRAVGELQRDRTVHHHVGAMRQPDGPHSTPRDPPDHPVRTDGVRNRRGILVVTRGAVVRGVDLRERAQESAAVGGIRLREPLSEPLSK